MSDTTLIAASISVQAKELAAAADFYARMPKLRGGLYWPMAQLADRLQETFHAFQKQWDEEYGPDK